MSAASKSLLVRKLEHALVVTAVLTGLPTHWPGGYHESIAEQSLHGALHCWVSGHICRVIPATEEDAGRQTRERGHACLPHVESGALCGVYMLQNDALESRIGFDLPQPIPW